MTKDPDFDLDAAHKYFAAHCFNRAWDLIEKADRTPADDRMMVSLNQASLFHWSQRPDIDDKRRSVGYWQASRIQALLGNAAEARRYADVCLSYSHKLEPFYLGYAFEALTRAARLAGNTAESKQFLAAAAVQAAKVSRTEDRALLEADLDGLSSSHACKDA
jgi:hypothetical protein